jgi:hypothetical protein
MLCCKATLALSKYFDSARSQPHLNLFLRKPVQHAVIMPLDIDMVIGADRDPRIIAGGCSSQTRVATMRHSPQSELEILFLTFITLASSTDMPRSPRSRPNSGVMSEMENVFCAPFADVVDEFIPATVSPAGTPERMTEESTQVENSNGVLSDSGAKHSATNDGEWNNPANPVDSFHDDIVGRCQTGLDTFLSAKSNSDFRVWQYLTVVAESVLDRRFEIDVLAQRSRRKVTKAHRKNPYLFLMQCIAPDKSRQYISKQSVALQYAVSQCGNDTTKLLKFFQKTGISQCVNECRLLRRAEKKPKKQVSAGLVVEGAPETLTGRIIVELEVSGRKAIYIGLLDPQ